MITMRDMRQVGAADNCIANYTILDREKKLREKIENSRKRV